MDEILIDESKRKTLVLLGAGSVIGLAGCCGFRGFPESEIDPASTKMSPRAFLSPLTINKKGQAITKCVDVHAHFFNASDVTVQGYLEGPVAHSSQGVIRDLIRALAPLADAIAGLAPTAKSEFDKLNELDTLTVSKNAIDTRGALVKATNAHRQQISEEFYNLVMSWRGTQFREVYKKVGQKIKSAGVKSIGAPRILELDKTSVQRAMAISETPLSDDALRAATMSDNSEYPEGVLAFIGYMLSYRWSNLMTYQAAFSEHENSVGVERTLGALVDFDRWLQCPPRSSHEDQVRLHIELSRRCSGYMLPLVAYNPWTDIAENGRGLAVVETAIKAGCVGVKIYPPNGFRPWGNSKVNARPGQPDGEAIDRVLRAFWEKCGELDVPVMAHTSESMGADNEHDELGGPDGWKQLLAQDFWSNDKGPRVNLGHFGGEAREEPEKANDWTNEFAELMKEPKAQGVFADLGYWDKLQCGIVGTGQCKPSMDRLRDVLIKPIGQKEIVADRVMYGSDWLMLSKEKYWASYAGQLHQAIGEIGPSNVDKIFAQNARRCFRFPT